jgi:hypothetical protein
MRRLIPVALAALVVAGAACGSDGDGDKEAATTTTANVYATSTTVPQRVEQVLVALLTVRNKIFSAPDPARIGEYVLEECPCAAEDRAQLENLKAKTHRWATPIVQVEGVKLAERKGPDEVVLTAAASRPGEQIVDSNNTQVGLSRGPGLPPTGFNFLLKRKDGAWRIAGVAILNLPREEIAKIITDGIPSGPPDEKSAV